MSFPSATERLSHGEPTWFVNDKKVFTMFAEDHHGDGIVGAWIPAPPGVQEAMIEEDPARFFRPPYVGPRGWLGVRLDVSTVDWDEVRAIVEEAYRMVAPKKLSALLPPVDGPSGPRR